MTVCFPTLPPSRSRPSGAAAMAYPAPRFVLGAVVGLSAVRLGRERSVQRYVPVSRQFRCTCEIKRMDLTET
jgi:hypothetical protein